MLRAFYKDVRLTEALSRLLLSPKFIGAALFLLGCFLYVVRDYSPNWRLEKRMGAQGKRETSVPEAIKASRKNFMLLPFVPLAFIYLVIRLVRGLFRICVYCSMDGFLWTLAKIPSLFSWYVTYLSRLPELVKRTSPQYWERYIITPSTAVLDYGLKISKSNTASYLAVEPYHRRAKGLWYFLCSAWQSIRLCFSTFDSSFARPLYRTCGVLVSHVFIWIAVHGSYLGKRTLQHVQVPALDLIYDLGELFHSARRIVGAAQDTSKPAIVGALSSSGSFFKRAYESNSKRVLNIVPTWDQCINSLLLPTVQCATHLYRRLIIATWICSIFLAGGLYKYLNRVSKSTVSWTWTEAIPKFQQAAASASALLHEIGCSLLSQASRTTKYFSNHILRRADSSIARARSIAVSASARLYRIVRDAISSCLVLLGSKRAQFWLPTRAKTTFVCKQVFSLAFQVCLNVKGIARSILSYAVRWGASVTLNARPLVVSVVQEVYRHALSWTSLALKYVGLTIRMTCRVARTSLEKLLPVVAEFIAKASSIVTLSWSALAQLIHESYHEIRPVVITWKQTIVYAADEVIQQVGRALTDEIKSKWD
ncbi:hypothetical protein K493DRAFT_320263 [Basidiobolus meristosporus CBS 931.73]|uniref:Uncharacterized protein n=1 Tax=Basidiobolus meristosporus CBS 931.73 TaxID=1314790 RepID=A0A1Y1XCF4_9FUNG|nr:hypothetical protein K493DRAFT_320263 [Basidiobolus meristosporus CBS 931.73]|eukprot:ORX83402.1 hypothetical protein K493DRAFT_320263 [Basidiobolus meristosporus CBS 931.73]